MREKIGFIAVGQAGGNVGKLLKDKNFDVVFINSSIGDLGTLGVNDELKYHITNGLGCAKDRDSAKQVAKEDFKNINKFIDDKLGNKELYYIIFSSGGGTGSGISPALARILTKVFNKNIGLITIFPSDKDTLQAKINSYECTKEITEIEELCGILFLDNKTRKDIEHINKRFVSLFNKIFDYKKYETIKGNIDEAEILKLLQTKGMISLSSCEKGENTDKLIKNIEDGVFAPFENDRIIKYLGLSRGIKFDDEIFKEKIGKYLDKFENVNQEYTLAILSGLSFPLKRINDIKEEVTKEKETIITLNTEKEIKLEDLDFIKPKKEKKQEIKDDTEVTMEDLINELF